MYNGGNISRVHWEPEGSLMGTWKIAAVQMDCRFADKAQNLEVMQARLREAAGQGARLAIFPECALTGYCFESKDEARPHAEPLPGRSIEVLAKVCRQLNVWAVGGMLEAAGDDLFNACALVGPGGFAGSYRKIHLPFLGVDRFTTPGDRPFAIHAVEDLRLGINICYDGSFPEAARCLMLLGADLVVLPTNWPTGAASTVKYLMQARALENHMFYAAVNRVGSERGFHFIGQSRIIDVTGELLAASSGEEETILYAEIDPAKARNKQIIKIPGKYELHRTQHRRPEMYGPLVQPREP
jgi:predicted amidohydrolase